MPDSAQVYAPAALKSRLQLLGSILFAALFWDRRNNSWPSICYEDTKSETKECFMSEFKVNTVCADALGDSDATALAERLEKGEVRTCK